MNGYKQEVVVPRGRCARFRIVVADREVDCKYAQSRVPTEERGTIREHSGRLEGDLFDTVHGPFAVAELWRFQDEETFIDSCEWSMRSTIGVDREQVECHSELVEHNNPGG